MKKKIIYMGFPMTAEFEGEDTVVLSGFWSFLLEWEIIPYNGMLFIYEGNYIKALWHWLFGDLDEV